MAVTAFRSGVGRADAAQPWNFGFALSMRREAEIIGKLDRDQGSGVRDQKNNDLWEAGRIYFGRGDLTSLTTAAGANFLSPAEAGLGCYARLTQACAWG